MLHFQVMIMIKKILYNIKISEKVFLIRIFLPGVNKNNLDRYFVDFEDFQDMDGYSFVLKFNIFWKSPETNFKKIFNHKVDGNYEVFEKEKIEFCTNKIVCDDLFNVESLKISEISDGIIYFEMEKLIQKEINF